MTSLHPGLLSQLFNVALNKSFSVEREGSHTVARYHLYKNGLDMTGSLTSVEMQCVLSEAVEVIIDEVVAKLLK